MKEANKEQTLEDGAEEMNTEVDSKDEVMCPETAGHAAVRDHCSKVIPSSASFRDPNRGKLLDVAILGYMANVSTTLGPSLCVVSCACVRRCIILMKDDALLHFYGLSIITCSRRCCDWTCLLVRLFMRSFVGSFVRDAHCDFSFIEK